MPTQEVHALSITTSDLRPLTVMEVDQVNGGFILVAAFLAGAALTGIGIGIGYALGPGDLQPAGNGDCGGWGDNEEA